MKINVDFEIPQNVAAKLLTGEYERVGGVIRHATNRKKIVMWMKETGISPRSPNFLSHGNPLLSNLSMVGSIASVLNLGATVAFGVATLNKLGNLEIGLAEMSGKQDVLLGMAVDLMAKGDETFERLSDIQKGVDKANQTLGRVESKVDVLQQGVKKANRTLGRLEKNIGQINRKATIIISKLGELEDRVQDVQWSVDFGFVRTLQAIDDIKQFHEIELASELNSAANMAWTCQFLELNNPQRMTRIENAFHTASMVKEKLLLHTEKEMQKAVTWMKDKQSLCVDDCVIDALFILRQSVVACALSASISAEANDSRTAGENLAKEHSKLFSLLNQLGQLTLNSDFKIYQTLLSNEFKDIMPMSRLDFWVKRFDSEFDGADEVVELLRIKGFPDTKSEPSEDNDKFLNYIELLEKEFNRVQKQHRQTLVNAEPNLVKRMGKYLNKSSDNSAYRQELQQMQDAEEKLDKMRAKLEVKGGSVTDMISSWFGGVKNSVIGTDRKNTNTELFVDLMDGLYEDLERLLGYEVEYKTIADLGLSIHEYRDLLRLDNIPENQPLAFFTITDNEVESV